MSEADEKRRPLRITLTIPQLIACIVLVFAVAVGPAAYEHSQSTTQIREAQERAHLSARLEAKANSAATLAGCYRGNTARRQLFGLAGITAEVAPPGSPALVKSEAIAHELVTAPHALADGALECTEVVEEPPAGSSP